MKGKSVSHNPAVTACGHNGCCFGNLNSHFLWKKKYKLYANDATAIMHIYP